MFSAFKRAARYFIDLFISPIAPAVRFVFLYVVIYRGNWRLVLERQLSRSHLRAAVEKEE